MTVLAAIFYFLGQHSLWSLPLLVLAGLAVGACLARWLGHPAWYALGIAGFVAGMAHVFTGSMANALFVNAVGTYGSAVLPHAEKNRYPRNKQPLWAHDPLRQTPDRPHRTP